MDAEVLMRAGAIFVGATFVAAGTQLASAVGTPAKGGPPDTVRVRESTSGQQANNINGRFSAPAVDGVGDVVASVPGQCPDIYLHTG